MSDAGDDRKKGEKKAVKGAKEAYEGAASTEETLIATRKAKAEALRSRGENPFANDVTSGNPHRNAVADDQCARARQIAQRLQRVLGLLRLVQRDADDDADRAKNGDRLFQITQEQIYDAGRNEQEQHRLTHDIDGDRQQRPRLRGGKLVGTVQGKLRRGLAAGEAGRSRPNLSGGRRGGGAHGPR